MIPLSRVATLVPALRAACVLVVAVAIAGCRPDTTDATPTRTLPRRDGPLLVEITFHDVGAANMGASAAAASSVDELERLRTRGGRASSRGASYNLTLPQGTTAAGDATIQLDLLGTGAFTQSATGNAPATRYLQATFRVRNAQRSDSAAFDTPRRNLTFVAVATSATIRETAVRVLELPGGVAANPNLALQVAPTGAAASSGGTITASFPDVMQVLTEAEAAAIQAPPGVTNVFPYGFIVRRAGSTTTRTLDPSPAPEQYDGSLTVAFRIPVQSNPAADPTRISVMLLALDDSETRITQSLEEQGSAARIATGDRASSLGASTVTLLPGGSLPGQGGVRTVCAVRIGGPSTAPTAYLVNAGASFTSIVPNPFAANGDGSFISATTSLQVAFSAPVTGATAQTFVVRGLTSGQAFVGQAYAGNGSATITTPAGRFMPGEEVEFVVTNTLSCPRPQVGRLRVAAGAAAADFSHATDNPVAVGDEPTSVAVADFNGDHFLDLAVANSDDTDSTVSVLLGRGDGTFGPQRKFTTQSSTVGVAAGDLDGDGIVDLVVTALDRDVSVLLGNGDGTFRTPQIFQVLRGPQSVVLGDLNGDGSLDVVVTNQRDDVIAVALGNGDGTLGPARTFPAVADPREVVLGDINGDGALDLATGSANQPTIAVLLGNGDGTFRAPITTASGTTTQALALGDLNGDGRLDLVSGGFTPNQVDVFFGNGDGTFVVAQVINAGNGTRSIAIGDINGDRVLDLAIAINSGANVVVLLGNGDGTFGAPQPSPVDTDGWSVRLCDLNGDTRLDLVVVNNQRDDVSIFLNGATAAPRGLRPRNHR